MTFKWLRTIVTSFQRDDLQAKYYVASERFLDSSACWLYLAFYALSRHSSNVVVDAQKQYGTYQVNGIKPRKRTNKWTKREFQTRSLVPSLLLLLRSPSSMVYLVRAPTSLLIISDESSARKTRWKLQGTDQNEEYKNT